MIRIVLAWFLVLSAFGQSSKPMVSIGTIADLTARFPNGPERVQVSGWHSEGDWGTPRVARHIPGSTLATNLGCVFIPVADVGRWVFDDCESGEVDATWFGATGDGTTDDTTALQAVIDWAGEQLVVVPSLVLSNAWGATIRFPDGKIFVHDTLQLKRGVRLIGRATADKPYPNDTSAPRLLLKAGATGPSLSALVYTNHLGDWEGPGMITLQGLVFDGNFDNQNTNDFRIHGLHVDGGATAYAKNWNIEGCSFLNHVGFSIFARNALGASTIRKCFLGNGLFTTDTADMKVENCDITGRVRGALSYTQLNTQPFPAMWLADYNVCNAFSDIFVYCGPTNGPGRANSIRQWTVTGYDTTNDVVTVASTNGMHEGMPLVWLTQGSHPGGINSNFTYYPTFVGTNTFKVSRIALWNQIPRQYDDLTSGTPTNDVLSFGQTAVLFINGANTTVGNLLSNIRVQDGDDRIVVLEGVQMNSFANLLATWSYGGLPYITLRGGAYNNSFMGGNAQYIYPLVGKQPTNVVELWDGTLANRFLGFSVLGGLSNNVLNASRSHPGNYVDNTMPWRDTRIGNAAVTEFIDTDLLRTNTMLWDGWTIYFKRNDANDVANTAEMAYVPSGSSTRLEFHGDGVPTQLAQWAYGDFTAYGRLDFTTTGGTRATNEATRSGNLAAIFVGGHDGVAQTASRASMIMRAPTTWNLTNNPTEIVFEVTDTMTTNRIEAVRIETTGDLTITNNAPVIKAVAGNGISGLRFNILGASNALLRLQYNTNTVLTITTNGATTLNTVANLTGGSTANVLRGDGAFSNVIAGPLTVTGITYSPTNLYQDIIFLVSNLDPPGIATPPSVVANSGRDSESLAAVFNNNDLTVMNVQMPHDVRTNGMVYPHLHCEMQTANPNTNTWIIKYAIADIGGTFPAWTRVTNTVTQAAGQWAHRMISLPTNGIPMTGFNGPSTILKLRIECVTTVEDVHVTSADVHIPIRGSPVAYTP